MAQQSMVNFYSSQINLLNCFRHDEGLNRLCGSHIKVDENSPSTTAHHRQLQITARTYFCKPNLVIWVQTHKIERQIYCESTSQKSNSLTEVFWPQDFYITGASSLLAPIVIRKAIMMTTSHALDLMKQGTEIDIAIKWTITPVTISTWSVTK